MIYSSIDNLALVNCGPIKTVVDFMMEKGASLPDGTHDIADGMFVQIMHYEAVPAEQRYYESHVQYVDVQIEYDGAQTIYCQPLTPGMKAVDNRLASDDICFYADPESAEDAAVAVTLKPGFFLVLMPEDAHKTECYAGVRQCRKAVAKIPVDRMRF